MKGQDSVNDFVYPDINFTKCNFHIGENIKQKSGVGYDVEVFKKLAYSLTFDSYKAVKSRYNRQKRPQQVKEYFKNPYILKRVNGLFMR